MSTTYFWDGQQVVPVIGSMTLQDAGPYMGMPCVDPAWLPSSNERYGMFMKRRDDWPSHWEGGKPEDLPKEFRAQLLLLGVS